MDDKKPSCMPPYIYSKTMHRYSEEKAYHLIIFTSGFLSALENLCYKRKKKPFQISVGKES